MVIKGRRVVAVSDTSMNGDILVPHWILTTNANDAEVEGGTELN